MIPQQMKVVEISRPGGPEVLRLAERPLPVENPTNWVELRGETG